MSGVLARVLTALAVLGFVLAAARTSAAHPAGFTSVNRYVGVSCDAKGRVHLAYLLDFAELPAYAEIERLDANHDGAVDPAEQRAYLEERLAPIVAAWTVEIDGARASLHVTGSSLEVPPGERGLSTLRIAADVLADRPDAPANGGASRDVRVRVVEPVFAERSGWREMSAEESADATVASGAVASPADILAYSNPAAGGPPRVDEASFVFHLRLAPGASPAPARVDAAAAPPRPDAPANVDPGLASLASALRRAAEGPTFSAIALGLAFALGAAHALSPGHGKALAAAYLVGRRARASHAVLFGAAVTVAHTAVVFLVGSFALALERSVGSDRLLRGLALVSAVAVVVLGVVQLSRRWREVTGEAAGHAHAHDAVESPDGLRSLLALGASSGLTPCPSALALLLSAIALHRVGFGLVLVLAFSAGVAVTLSIAGLLVVMARRLVDRWAGGAPVLRWLPVMSSMCVLILGILLCASSLSR
ncbi:MAG TPA: sulfite exporter TauE/SafE family protein [Polyangiaceae bacterium]|nr:sulfite exporter TauE/SafE family protein [Polyangiaceae bacterium]